MPRRVLNLVFYKWLVLNIRYSVYTSQPLLENLSAYLEYSVGFLRVELITRTGVVSVPLHNLRRIYTISLDLIHDIMGNEYPLLGSMVWRLVKSRLVLYIIVLRVHTL